jgi:hypothetical protein
MKTSKKTVNTEAEEASLIDAMPPKKRTEVEKPGDFAEEDDDFDLPLDDDLHSLDDLDLDDDDF